MIRLCKIHATLTSIVLKTNTKLMAWIPSGKHFITFKYLSIYVIMLSPDHCRYTMHVLLLAQNIFIEKMALNKLYRHRCNMYNIVLLGYFEGNATRT